MMPEEYLATETSKNTKRSEWLTQELELAVGAGGWVGKVLRFLM